MVIFSVLRLLESVWTFLITVPCYTKLNETFLSESIANSTYVSHDTLSDAIACVANFDTEELIELTWSLSSVSCSDMAMLLLRSLGPNELQLQLR